MMLEVSNLDAFYGEGHILHGIDLTVAEGERVAILGRNGAGKSTLLKSLMNAGPRAHGIIKFEGALLNELPSYQRARMGMALVPEDRRIFNHLTVTENIAMGAFGAGVRVPGDPRSILDQFEMLRPLAHRYGGQLSGGQQQLLAVARAFAASPRLLLLDEPTEGLAPKIIEQMAKEISLSCKRDQVGMILCEQNIWFARRCTERVHLIDSGKFVFSGEWPAFDADSELKKKYLAV